MYNKMVQKLIAIVMLLVLLCGVAVAEETTGEVIIPGNMTERGLVFQFTEADVSELYLNTSYMMASLEDLNQLPLAYISYSDYEAIEKAIHSYSEEELQDDEILMEILTAIFSNNYNIYTIALIEKDYYDAKLAAGKTVYDMIEVEETEVLGENDGYVYVGFNSYNDARAAMETDIQKANLEKAIARCDELIAGMTFQPVVFAEGEVTEIPEGALTFSTQDLNGNTVTNELFLGKKLTVLNVWGTYCTPCIEEMPELAEWSQNMPEGVQLVGLVSDLPSADDADILETAKYICEATGADVYTHLIAGADFIDLLSGVVGVPTTFFINGNGEFVGDPVVGANVPALKAFVESYVAE